MKNRIVTCKHCKNKEKYPQVEMHVVDLNVEGKKPKYWHLDCYEIYLKEQQKKEKQEERERRKKDIENKKWDNLFETIKEIHEIPKEIVSTETFPKEIIITLQDWRNGTERFSSNRKIRRKQGIEYDVIEKAYQMSRKQIHWARKNKQFKDIKNEMKYCLAIVRNKLIDAKNEIKRQKELAELYVNPHHSYSEVEVEPMKEFPKK